MLCTLLAGRTRPWAARFGGARVEMRTLRLRFSGWPGHTGCGETTSPRANSQPLEVELTTDVAHGLLQIKLWILNSFNYRMLELEQTFKDEFSSNETAEVTVVVVSNGLGAWGWVMVQGAWTGLPLSNTTIKRKGSIFCFSTRNDRTQLTHCKCQ